MGRLRELLDELAASRAAAQLVVDETAADDWLSEGGSPDPERPAS